MEIKENNAGLGKNHDEEAKNDLAKKQSEALPATENLDHETNSVNKEGKKEFLEKENENTENTD